MAGGARKVEAEEVFEDFFVDLGAFRSQRMIGREGLAGAGVEPDFGPVFGPVSGGVGGCVGGEDGFVELKVGDFEPGGALVVEVGEGAFFEARIFGGGGHDGGVAEEWAGFSSDR